MTHVTKWIGGALALGLVLSVHAATNDDLLFYCNFDGSATATFARGDSTPTSAVPPEFQPGVRGQAVVIGGAPGGNQDHNTGEPVQPGQEINCCYAPEKNLDVYQGAVSFWVKPLDWDGKTKGMNVLFFTSPGGNFFQIYKFFSDDQLYWLRGDQQQGWAIANHRIGHYWKPGEWHHIAATWSQDEIRFYIDGALVKSCQVKHPFTNAAPVTPFSVGPSGSWKKAFIGRSLVDEFRIHSRPLNDEEIIELYRRDSAAVEIESGIITVGRKTTVLDGKVNNSEYAFSGSGFNDLKGYISPQQGFHYLSYDQTNLYLAVASGSDDEKQAPAGERDGDFASSERVEVYLVPDEKTQYRFVFTPSGGIYDEKNGEKGWNSAGLKTANGMSNGTWTLEAVIPFADLGLKAAPDGGKWRVNIGRVFLSLPATASVAPVKGSLDDRSQFTTLVFRPDAPFIQSAVSSVQSTNPLAEITLRHIDDSTLSYGFRSFSWSLYSKGKSTPMCAYRSASKFYLSEDRIVENAGGEERTLFLGRSIFEEPSPMRVNYLYIQGEKRLFVSARQCAAGSIRARFLKPDGGCAFESSKPLPTDSSYFSALFDLDFEKLVPGLYNIKIDHVAPDGKATETWEQEISIPKKDDPMFQPYVDPEADKVPVPWTALKSGKDKVEMWGREYDFSKGFLFSSLKSQGEEILAAPAELRVDGKAAAPEGPVGLEKKTGTDMMAEWKKSADLGKLKVESDIKTHFDGFCEVAMTFTPDGGEQEIKALALDIPLRGSAATLVNDGKYMVYSDMASKTGAVGDYWHQSHVSMIWVGNDRVGFNWESPDFENWNCKKTEKQVEIIRDGNKAVLRFNLVDTPTNWSGPRMIKFGFSLTPSKPLNRKFLRARLEKDWAISYGCKYFGLMDYDTYERSAINARLRQAKENTGTSPKEVFVYMTAQFISPFTPEWAWWEEKWRGNDRYGEWTGDATWSKKHRNSGIYVASRQPTYVNFMLNKRAIFFEKARVPLTPEARNYYYDGHGGREITLNTWRMIRRTGPEAKIWTHTCFSRRLSTDNFIDIFMDGESLEPHLDGDNYYKILTPEKFRATFSPYIWGVKTVFMSMLLSERTRTGFDISWDNPAQRTAILHVLGYLLTHDTDLYLDGGVHAKIHYQKVFPPLWAAQDKLGWDENVVFHPYWEQDAVKLVSPKSDRIMASAYTKNGKMLLAVLNDTDKEETVRLDLDINKLGVKEGLKGSDVWQPDATYTLSSSWEGKMPPRAFRLILWGAE